MKAAKYVLEKPQTEIAYQLLYGDLQNKDSLQDKTQNNDSGQEEILEDEESSDSSTDDEQTGKIDEKKKRNKSSQISYDKFVRSINDLVNFEKASDLKYTELYSKSYRLYGFGQNKEIIIYAIFVRIGG